MPHETTPQQTSDEIRREHLQRYVALAWRIAERLRATANPTELDEVVSDVYDPDRKVESSNH